MTKLTLGEAAKHSGFSKPTLSAAIKKGRLTATKREDGSFAIDPAELDRWKDASTHRNSNVGRIKTPGETAAEQGVNTDAEVKALRLVIEQMHERLREKDQRIEDIGRERDKWSAQAERLALTAPQQVSKRGLWGRLVG